MADVDEQRATELLRVLNSTPVVDGEPRDLLGAEVGEAVRRARGALQAVVRGGSPTLLEPLLEGVVRRPVATVAGLDWETGGEAEWHADRAEAVALVLAWDHVERTLPGRLRPCANDACTLFLLDRSRSGAGRWCSMAACGNRAKARRHYERTRAGSRADG